MSSERQVWEYGYLYFVTTWTDKGDYGPLITVIETGKGLDFISGESEIQMMNRLGEQGWIIDRDTTRVIPGYIPVAEKVSSVPGADRIGDFTRYRIRRQAL